MTMKTTTLLLTGLFFCVALQADAADERREKVLKDRTEVQSLPQWIYNDLAKGFAEARQTGKPLLVVLRCIP